MVSRTAIISLVLCAAPYAFAQEVPETPVDGAADGQNQEGEDTSELGVDIRSLEEQVHSLKEKVFKSKARLVLLRETVLDGAISSARVVISHQSEMGSSFRLKEINYSLDGEALLTKTAEGAEQSSKEELELFRGSMPAGTHNLSVVLIFKGNGYGIFTYLNDYQFKVKASYPFTAEEGKQISVKAIAYERGGITTDLQYRPSVRFEASVSEGLKMPVEPAAVEKEQP